MIASNNEAVQTENLTKVYKDFWGRDKVRALDDLTLTINRGEVFGLLGPNGSGKSTTIKLLLGLIFPSRGSARVLGEKAGSTVINEKIGFLPEESYLYRFLNGEETLRFYGQLFKIPRKELNRRIPALLDTVGLDAKSRKRKLREYSKGMARRIGLAQALINNPDLILLDEPTTGLDPIGTREMKDLILSLKNQGKTVLLCSHLLADVQDVCDRITILFRGRMQTIGQVSDLLKVRDVTQIETRGMTDEQVAETRLFLDRMGVHDAAITHPTTTLEDLFVRVVRENTPGIDLEAGFGGGQAFGDAPVAPQTNGHPVAESEAVPQATEHEPVAQTPPAPATDAPAADAEPGAPEPVAASSTHGGSSDT
jgi:ABC-2 type transport system ATP-binding protein